MIATPSAPAASRTAAAARAPVKPAWDNVGRRCADRSRCRAQSARPTAGTSERNGTAMWESHTKVGRP